MIKAAMTICAGGAAFGLFFWVFSVVFTLALEAK